MKTIRLIFCREKIRCLGFRCELNEICALLVVIPYQHFGTTVSYKIRKYTVRTELSSFNVCLGKWVCECMGFVMCGCFDNFVGVLVICVLVLTVFCTVCTVFLYCFLYVYSYLFCLYWCKDYCHRVTTELQ